MRGEYARHVARYGGCGLPDVPATVARTCVRENQPPLPSAVRTKVVEGCRHQSIEIILGDKTWLPEPKQIKDTVCQLGF